MGVYVSDDNARRIDAQFERLEKSVSMHAMVDAINELRNVWKIAKEETRLKPPSPLVGTYKCDQAKLAESNFTAVIDVPVSIEASLQAAFGVTDEQVREGVRAKAVYFNVADDSEVFDTAQEAVAHGKLVGVANDLHENTELSWGEAMSAAKNLAELYVFERKKV